MCPLENIPVVQLSLPRKLQISNYFAIGQNIGELKDYGIMILTEKFQVFVNDPDSNNKFESEKVYR